MSSLLIRNGVVITMNDAFDIVHGDVSIRDGRIAAVGPELDRLPAAHDAIVDAHGGWVLPGFVQTHLHLCQTLFRGLADDLTLMDWLRTRVWPDGSGTHSGDPRASARPASPGFSYRAPPGADDGDRA
jgi:cytosine/adenosine deaminase-related metal-dependent hydrolase